MTGGGDLAADKSDIGESTSSRRHETKGVNLTLAPKPPTPFLMLRTTSIQDESIRGLVYTVTHNKVNLTRRWPLVSLPHVPIVGRFAYG